MLYHINRNIPIRHNPHTSVTVSITKFTTLFSMISLLFSFDAAKLPPQKDTTSPTKQKNDKNLHFSSYFFSPNILYTIYYFNSEFTSFTSDI